MVCAHSSIEVSQEDEFVCPGCSRNHRIQIIVELSLTSSGLVIVGALALTIVACLLPDKGSLSVIRRSFMPFGSPERLLTRCDFMAKPTPASRCYSFLRPLQKKVYPAPASFKSPSSARRVSLRAAIFTLYRSSSLPSRAVVRCGLSEPALSMKVLTFHAPIIKGITFIFFFLAGPLNGIAVDRG